MVLVWFVDFQNKIRTQQNKEEFASLVERPSGLSERCSEHVSCLVQVDMPCTEQIAWSTLDSCGLKNVSSAHKICLCIFQKLPPQDSKLYFHRMQHKPFSHMHRLRSHLKRNHFRVRCELCLRSYLGALCQGTELVVCLLLPTNKHHVNTRCTNIGHDKHMMPRLGKSSHWVDRKWKCFTATNQLVMLKLKSTFFFI